MVSSEQQGGTESFADTHRHELIWLQKAMLITRSHIITTYQLSLKLHKLVNENISDLDFEQITVFDQMVCTRRQLNFEIHRNNKSKIGLNCTANKLYPLSGKIPLDMLSKDFVYYKKLAKIMFLKYGNT